MDMNKNLKPISLSVATHVVPAAAAPPEGAVPHQKRGFKPRWLRLQRRERKLKEARALALRAVVG